MRNKSKFWDFRAKGDHEGALFLYGEIASSTWYGDEVTPKAFKSDLDALGDINVLHVYINSPGGDVFAGYNIINILERHKARKIGYNDGLAASIAFDILMSMDEVIAMSNSMFMTHNCWAFAIGNRHELRAQADMMEKIDGMLARTSAKRSGKTEEEIMTIQDAEKWYTAQEAVNEGFADRVHEGIKLAASIDDGFFVCGNVRMDLSKCKNVPEKLIASAPVKYQQLSFIDIPSHTHRILPHHHTITLPQHTHRVPQSMYRALQPCNGGESQPVKDKAPAQDALKRHRQEMNRIKRKILEGYENE